MIPYLFDENEYKTRNKDLASLYKHELRDHFFKHGLNEGRTPNSLHSRSDFTSLFNNYNSILEIGPFASPVYKGKNVKYLDVIDSKSLVLRAKKHSLPIANIPKKIHFVGTNLDCVDELFDIVFSSHVIEHQPDIIGHLNSVEKILSESGRYVMCIPDKRFCFDHNLSESSVADMIDPFIKKNKLHTLKSVIEHRCLTTHNDCKLYWDNNFTNKDWDIKLNVESLRNAINEFNGSNGSYIDVHAFFFTPLSFLDNLKKLLNLELTNLIVERIYPTKIYHNEFWVVLKKGEVESPDPNLSYLK